MAKIELTEKEVEVIVGCIEYTIDESREHLAKLAAGTHLDIPLAIAESFDFAQAIVDKLRVKSSD